MSDANFDESVIANMPYYIAINCDALMHSTNSEERVKLILHLYRLTLHTLTIVMVSQYLIQDKSTVHHSQLNALLIEKFPKTMTLDAWQEILFTSLQVYEGNKQLLFLPELYELYWKITESGEQPRVRLERLFNRLTTKALELQQPRFAPQDAKAWQALEADLWPLFQQFLEAVSFLKDYDLVRVLDLDEESYEVELYKGVKITQSRQPLPPFSKLSRGWFYLRNQENKILLLHPLLVFWDTEHHDNEPINSETGVYDRFTLERLRYLATNPGTVFEDDRNRNIEAFISLVYDTIESIKTKRQEADRLTWLDLRKLSAKISQQRMAAVRNKYKEALYLERAKVHDEFLRFLESDKRGFVLIGKSGVGKSNFLVALNDELNSSRQHVCLLMYDGAQIGEGSSISEIVAQDFNNHLILAGKRIENIWQTIAQIQNINDNLVVLCVDAINESAQARDLLRQLDDLVLTPWPWLKVVFTSRPETWRAIRRGVGLAQSLYYTETGSDALEVGLEPISYSERMEPFSRDELREAYAKYQEEFHLQTEFTQLSSSIREILREPLNLWLVASTYHHRQVPDTTKVVGLVDQYVTGLVESARIQLEDLRLLEKRLVPLLAKPGHFSNMITVEDIESAGDDLYEAIYSSQILSDGRRVNESFRNLVDAEILVRQQETRVQRIGFKYERFYEYFVGRRLFDLSRGETDRQKFFIQMVGMTANTPFLWGAIRNALIQDFLSGEDKVIRALCYTERQRVKEMMVDMLATLGRDHLNKVTPILVELIPSQGNTGKRMLFRPRRIVSLSIPMRNAGKVAVEVAGSLGLINILRIAALQKDATIRTAAVRYAYRYWSRQQDKGFELLEQLALETTRSKIPNFTAFESTMGLSAVIFFDHVHDAMVLKRLQHIWHGLINKVLSIRETSGPLSRLTRSFIRERLMSLAVSIAFKLVRDLPDYNVFSYERLEAFFHLNAEEKALYVRMTKYLNADVEHPVDEMRADFLTAFKIRRDVLVTTICHMGLAVYAVRNKHASLPFLEELFEAALSDHLPNVWVSVIPVVLEALLDRYPSDDIIFNMFQRVVAINHEYYASEFGRPGLLTSESPEAAYLGTYIFYQSFRNNGVRTDWLQSRIDAALARSDLAFFRSLLNTHLPIVGIERSKPNAALDVLSLFFHRGTPEIDQLNLRFLARLRVYYPDEVDVFLDDQQASDDVQLQVRTNEPIETVGELIGLRAFHFVRDDVIIGSETLRQQIIRIFARIAECKNTREWINYLIREIVNLVYGGEALPQPR